MLWIRELCFLTWHHTWTTRRTLAIWVCAPYSIYLPTSKFTRGSVSLFIRIMKESLTSPWETLMLGGSPSTSSLRMKVHRLMSTLRLILKLRVNFSEQIRKTLWFISLTYEPDHNGGYLTECRVADPWKGDTWKSWARDSTEAERLWKLSEKLVGQEFIYWSSRTLPYMMLKLETSCNATSRVKCV